MTHETHYLFCRQSQTDHRWSHMLTFLSAEADTNRDTPDCAFGEMPNCKLSLSGKAFASLCMAQTTSGTIPLIAECAIGCCRFACSPLRGSGRFLRLIDEECCLSGNICSDHYFPSRQLSTGPNRAWHDLGSTNLPPITDLTFTHIFLCYSPFFSD